MIVEQGIRELLKSHDCVILPGFGGFLARYSPARIDNVRHHFEPPCRVISFNGRLSSNDGLLINHISRVTGVPYKKAEETVSSFAQHLKETLDKKRKVEVPGIGTLEYSQEGQISFLSPINPDMWEEGFGLSSFISPAVVRREKSLRTSAVYVNREPARYRRGIPAAVKITLAAAIPVIIFLLYGIINPTGIKKISTNYSGIFQLSNLGNPPPSREVTSVFKMIPYSFEGQVKNSIPGMKPQTPEALPELSNELSSVPEGFHIIAGTFTSEIKAAGFINKFREKGYSPLVTGLNKYGHYRVSIQSFGRKSEALEFLAMFRKKEIPDAWLLKK